LLRRLYGLLEHLGPRDRLIFVLNRMDSMSVQEIATAMEISESTVKRSLAHASDRIRHFIQAEPRWLKEEKRGQ
jgi:RNA polymerase sigma factor (sigma-70 family)